MSKDKFEIRTRRFLNKTFNEFRGDMLNYVKTYYPDKLQDFSENSILGSLVDISAFVGDNLSFYLDHQFSELDPETAIEDVNLQSHIRNSGVKISGASPSIATLTFEIEIPADQANNNIPLYDALPVIKNTSVFSSTEGINFRLLENLDFSAKKQNGDYDSIILPNLTSNNQITSYIFKKQGVVISGNILTETFNLGDFIKFRKISLSNQNVTEIISVTDSFNNQYYEVNDLADDTVYLSIQSVDKNDSLVKDSIKIISAPFRFTTETDIDTKITTLTMGGGSAQSYEFDAVPDPSEFAVNFYGRTINKDFSLNPSRLLNTKTLGISSENCDLQITYRYGGGIDHNVSIGSISEISIKDVDFQNPTDLQIRRRVLKSIIIYNEKESSGGTDALTVQELKSIIKNSKNSQSRIVTKEDLLARIYTMPNNFGRVFRACIKDNPKNPLATQLYIISKNSSNELIISEDALKNNLKTYLNKHKLISDSIDILDAQIINLKLKFQIIKDLNYDKSTVLKNVLSKLKNYFDINNFYIEQPIIISEVITLIMSTEGVIAIEPFQDKSLIQFECNVGNTDNRLYSNINIPIEQSIKMGLLIPPDGSIFEFKYPEFDFIGKIT